MGSMEPLIEGLPSRIRLLASPVFGRRLSVGAIRFEDRFVLAERVGRGGGWVHHSG